MRGPLTDRRERRVSAREKKQKVNGGAEDGGL